MGSLELLTSGGSAGGRRFNAMVAEGQFEYADGIPVMGALYVDQIDQPFERDVWTVDFSRVIGLEYD